MWKKIITAVQFFLSRQFAAGKPIVVGKNIPHAKLMKENGKLCGTNDFNLLFSVMSYSKTYKRK